MARHETAALDWTPTEGQLVAARVDRLLKVAGIRNSLGISPPNGEKTSWALFVQGGDGSGEARAALASIPGVGRVWRLPLTGAGVIHFDLDPSRLPAEDAAVEEPTGQAPSAVEPPP